MRWPEIDADPDESLWCVRWEVLFYVALVATAILIGGSHGNKEAAQAPQAGRVDAGRQRHGMGDGEDLVPQVHHQDGVEADGSDGDSEVP